jgi:hypothetical protein
MALFGGMFGSEKHPKLDQLTQAIHDSLGLTLAPPGDDVLQVIESLTPHELINIGNARSVEGAQEVFRAKSLLAVVDTQTQTLTLSVATPEEIDHELHAEHTAVKVLHVGEHRPTAHIIKSFGPSPEPVKAAVATPLAPTEAAAPPAPPAFEHLEAAERLCPVVVDLFLKHGQLTSGDKDVLKKIKPVDYTLEARIVALERWKTELARRARGVHVQQTGPTSLLGSAGDAAQKSEDVVLRRFEAFLHWLSKLIKALEHKGVKFHGKPVWLH